MSDVLCCSGMTRREMNSALEISVPQRMPQVSRLFCVFVDAMARNLWRSSGGRKTVRRGLPFSR